MGPPSSFSHRARLRPRRPAQDTDFWANMERYLRFTASTALGMAYIVVKPLYELVRCELRLPTTPLAAGVAGREKSSSKSAA